MNKSKSEYGIGSILLMISICALVVYMCLTFEPRQRTVNNLYQVYLGKEKIGLIKNDQELYDLIDKEQKHIKDKYNVEKVYPPSGLEIHEVATYRSDVKSALEIYEDIKDLDPFTIEGYEVIIKKEDKKEIFYVLDKDALDKAVENTVLSFVKEEEYTNYLNGVYSDSSKEGKSITDIYFEDEVTIKKTYVSTEEEIITDLDILSMYFLFGSTELTKKYAVKASDTLETIASKNKLGVSELLVANPELTSENTLLAVGQELTVARIEPITNIIVESFETEMQTIKYDTKIEYDKSLSGSKSYVKQDGVNGLSKVTYATKETNGVIVNTALVKEEVVSKAVDKIIVQGSKDVIYYGNTTYWAWPTSKPFRISSGYGYRYHPIRGESHFHGGMDITGTPDKKIHSIQNGTVIAAVNSGYNMGAGKYVTIDHGNGYTSRYLHLASVRVNKGDKVEKGQIIGIMGTTGSSTGVHLDFRVMKNGNNINPLNLYK